jgi:soluble lytic murein transglycosylase-like protein
MVLSFAVVLINAAQADNASTRHPARVRPAGSFANLIEEASRRFAVPAYWIRAVMDVESAGDVRARSQKGAMGPMQIMPETWAELRLRYDLGNDPYDPHDNILAGTAYLHELQGRYGSPGFLAAYNAGPARYEQHLAGRPLPAETKAYLQKLVPVISSDIAASSAVASLRSSAGALFVVRSDSSKATSRVQPEPPPNRAPTAASVHDISAIVPQAAGLFVAGSDTGGPR